MMGGFGFAGFGMVIGFLFLVGLVFLIAWGIGQFPNNTPATRANSGNAMEILKSRYARGEIDKPQYERMKADLT